MVLNLYRQNILLFFPGRFCLKNTDPLESRVIKMGSNRKKGENVINPIIAIKISTPLFIFDFKLEYFRFLN